MDEICACYHCVRRKEQTIQDLLHSLTDEGMCVCVCVVGSYLATKVFIGNLPAMGKGWVIIKLANDEWRSTTNMTLIRVHSTMHLVHPNYVCVCVCVCACDTV